MIASFILRRNGIFNLYHILSIALSCKVEDIILAYPWERKIKLIQSQYRKKVKIYLKSDAKEEKKKKTELYSKEATCWFLAA